MTTTEFKRKYKHTSGVTFDYNVNQDGGVADEVRIRAGGGHAGTGQLQVPRVALQAFGLVCRYESWAAHGEADGKPCLTPIHPRWPEFIKLLQDPEHLNVHRVGAVQPQNACLPDGPQRFRHIEAILQQHFPEVGVDDTLGFFTSQGGCCDCEVLTNVEGTWQRVHDMERAKVWASFAARTRKDPAEQQ